MEKRVTRHSSSHATKASTETTAPPPPEATPIDTAHGSKRGRGRGRSARGAQASASSVERGRGRGRGATGGQKHGASAAGESSAPGGTDHDHDHAESDHAQVSDQEEEHESAKKQGHEKEGESDKPLEPKKDKEVAKTQETEKEQEPDNNQEHSEDDSEEEEGSEEEDSSSSGSESESEGEEEEEEEEVSSRKIKDNLSAMDVDSEDTPNVATTANTDAAPQTKAGGMNEGRRLTKNNSALGAFDEVSSLPFISPTFPPNFDAKEVETMPLDSNDHLTLPAPSSLASSTTVKSKSTTASSTGPPTAASKGGFFLDESVYNKLSIGGTERIAELYMLKKRRREKGASPEPVPRLLLDTETGAPSTKPKRRVSGSFTALNIVATTTATKTASRPPTVPTHAPAPAPMSSSEDHTQTAPSVPPVVPAQSSTINLNDLIASVSSYKSEITSNVDKSNTTQQLPVQQPPQQQQQSTIAAIKPADIRYHHPCISAHQYRSSLTREEHRRYMMYDGVLRRQKTPGAPQLGQEDRALFGLLQERVEAERLRVRQWCDSECRSRVISYFNPLIRDALAPKFRRGRARVKEEYPQYYEFVHSIGLRLPGVPSTTKEPMLSRAQLEESKPGAEEKTGNKPTALLRRRGLLQRTGKICPVSLAKPILPTDENGVPYEKTIDVVDSYWNHSASPPPATDRRRGPMPFKRPAVSVAKDPVAKDFVNEQNVHIALSSSAMVALAKTLPSLANEWEIPVTVTLEEDSEGVMQKRIYVDKPLIPKRMTTLEITQAFYDGALKKLSLIGSSSSDVNVLDPQQDNAGAGFPASTDTRPHPSQATVSEQNDVEMQDATDEKEIHEGAKSPRDVAMEDSENREVDKANPSTESSEKKINVKSSKDNDEDTGVLGSQPAGKAVDEGSTDNFEYSLWTFGDMRLLIRNRLHGYLNNTIPHRQVVIKSILDYAPDIGVAEPGKSTMAGWWMATWVRDDRLLALGRVDVSKNQFVRYPDQLPPTYRTDNPLGGAFSDLPSISIKDTSALKVQDREIGDWIKPNMRLIHYILGKLQNLGPGQYILAHKRHDVSANVYRAVKTSSGEHAVGTNNESKSSSGAAAQHKGQYDLHAAHASSPQPLSDAKVEPAGALSGGGGSSSGGADDDLLLRWIGTPDQIPGTFPYEPESDTSFKKGKRGRGGAGGGGRGNKRKKGKGATKKAGVAM